MGPGFFYARILRETGLFFLLMVNIS
jgi:hypothetical protein